VQSEDAPQTFEQFYQFYHPDTNRVPIRPNHRRRKPHHHPPARRRPPVPTPTPPPPPPTPTPGCSYTLSSAGSRAPYAGDIGSVIVNTTAGCGWDAVSNSGFIHVTGINANTVSFAVDQNTTFNVRSGSITIAGIGYSITQDGHPLNFDGTYLGSFRFIINCPGIPAQGFGPFPIGWTILNGSVVNGGGVVTGGISSFGSVNIFAVTQFGTVQFTGSVSSTGHALGLLSVVGAPCQASGSWSADRQ
jgi:hypothetical protein